VSESLFSPHWYRVADLHPRLRGHVCVRRQVVRDQVWYLLSDSNSGRHHRLSRGAYRFVGLCDGRRNVQEIWDSVLDSMGDEAPTQGEVIAMLGRLAQAELLQTETTPDVEAMFDSAAAHGRRRRWQQLNPLFFRIPLADPTSLLRRFDAWLAVLFCPAALFAWVAAAIVGAIAGLVYWDELASHAAAWTLTPRYLLIAWFVYPLIKAVHELGHALAVRHWGGEVRQMGITLLLLTPIPWVDASAASTFPYRSQRLMVSAAGIMVEMAIAALALAVWLVVQPGLVRDVAFVVMFVGSVSTVLFNANPLLRFDGYFILSDLLDLPNLGPRSTAYWGQLTRRHLLRLEVEPMPLARREGTWLFFYGPVAAAYRLFISVAIVLWIGSKSFLLATAAGLTLLWTTILGPLLKALRAGWRTSGPAAQRSRARRISVAAVSLVVLFVLAVPLPLHTVADGVVWLPENARLRPETDGFVVQVSAADGSRVEPGQLLLVLEDPALLAERDRLEARLAELQSDQYHVLLNEPGRAQSLAQEMAHVEAEILRNGERIGQLQVRAEVAGRLVMPRQGDMPGTLARRGAELGYVLPPGSAQVRAVVAQQDVALVRDRSRSAQVWLIEQGGDAVPARAGREIPAATGTLPSAALGDRGGGAIPTDPKDQKGLTAAEPLFLVDLDLPTQPLVRVGARVKVRFDHGSEPLAAQAYRRLSQLFLKHFNHSV
jgi:putative peptide zinc metalloprotease protein